MLKEYEILYISKTVGKDAFESITHLCGKNVEGGKWCIPAKKAIEGIEKNELAFYIRRGNKKIPVIASGQYGKKSLKTINDGDVPTLLLALPNC